MSSVQYSSITSQTEFVGPSCRTLNTGSTVSSPGDIRSLFDEVMTLPLNQREGYLRLACGGDDTLFGEVMGLLQADMEGAGAFPTHAPVPESVINSLEPPDTATVAVGHYRLVRKIGEGGMGSVYVALRSDDVFRKTVAIKVMRRDRATEEFGRRFRQERQVLASLDHPHIARILDGGTTKDGLPYYVMEYVDGKPIDEYCDQGKLGLVDRIKLFQQVCSAVHYLHENSIVHRDLKPNNILVTSGGDVKLLDFGIAKVEAPGREDQTMDLTIGQSRLMTLEYASPEQISGETVSRPSDIYSLGVILYELLTGRLPFVDSQNGAVDRRLKPGAEPPKPSTNVREDVRHTRETTSQLKRRLLGDLDNVILMALNRGPSFRYTTARIFAEDLQNYLDGRSVLARPDSIPRKTIKLVRRNPLTSLAALAMALLIIFAIWQSLEAYRQRVRADAKEEEIAHLIDDLTARLTLWGSVASVATRNAAAFEEQTKDLQQMSRIVEEDFPRLLFLRPGRTPRRDALVQRAIGYFGRAESYGQANSALAKEVVRGYLSIATLQSRPVDAKEARGLGDRAGAITNFKTSGRIVIDISRRNPRDEELQRQLATIQNELVALGGTPLPTEPSAPLPVTGDRVESANMPAPATPPALSPEPAPPSVATVPISRAQTQMPQPLSSVPIAERSHSQVLFQIFDPVAEGAVLTVTLSALNQGLDRPLNVGSAQIIDDMGNTYVSNLITIANRQRSAQLLNGVKTNLVLTFREMDTIGGVLQANQIKRLAVSVTVGKDSENLEFWNIPIRKVQN